MFENIFSLLNEGGITALCFYLEKGENVAFDFLLGILKKLAKYTGKER